MREETKRIFVFSGTACAGLLLLLLLGASISTRLSESSIAVPAGTHTGLKTIEKSATDAAPSLLSGLEETLRNASGIVQKTFAPEPHVSISEQIRAGALRAAGTIHAGFFAGRDALTKFLSREVKGKIKKKTSQ